jgi:hypothetical protein
LPDFPKTAPDPQESFGIRAAKLSFAGSISAMQSRTMKKKNLGSVVQIAAGHHENDDLADGKFGAPTDLSC